MPITYGPAGVVLQESEPYFFGTPYLEANSSRAWEWGCIDDEVIWLDNGSSGG